MSAEVPSGAAKLRRLIRFALVGGFNTALDFILLFVFTKWLGINPYVANIASTGICLVISFFLNRRWTFESAGDARRQFAWFLGVTLAGLWGVQTLVIWLVHVGLPEGMGADLRLFVAKLVATGASLVWNYALYSRLVFPASEPLAE